MNRSWARRACACALLGFVVSALTQSRAEPLDGDFLERYAATYRFRLGKPSKILPTPDGRAVFFLRSGPRSFVRDLYRLDLGRTWTACRGRYW